MPATKTEDVAEEPEVEEQPKDQIAYISNRRLKVGVSDDGQDIFREVGDEIPEAEGWPTMIRERYIQEGHISRERVRHLPAKRGRPAKTASK